MRCRKVRLPILKGPQKGQNRISGIGYVLPLRQVIILQERKRSQGEAVPLQVGGRSQRALTPWEGHLLLGGLGYAEGAGPLRFDSCYEPWAYFAHTP